ncbi:hypothetical protein MRX96_049346 [Rhipicephalus microplus]
MARDWSMEGARLQRARRGWIKPRYSKKDTGCKLGSVVRGRREQTTPRGAQKSFCADEMETARKRKKPEHDVGSNGPSRFLSNRKQGRKRKPPAPGSKTGRTCTRAAEKRKKREHKGGVNEVREERSS